jgi:hypothetical protein
MQFERVKEPMDFKTIVVILSIAIIPTIWSINSTKDILKTTNLSLYLQKEKEYHEIIKQFECFYKHPDETTSLMITNKLHELRRSPFYNEHTNNSANNLFMVAISGHNTFPRNLLLGKNLKCISNEVCTKQELLLHLLNELN